MPNKTTKAEFARMCRVTKPAIAKAIVAGKVNLLDKKINLDHRSTAEYYYTKTGKVLNATEHGTKPKPPRKKPTQEPDTIDDQLVDDGYKLPPGIKCFEDITIHNVNSIPADLMKKFKELETAKKAKQDREHKRGVLVERVLVEQFMAKLHTVDTSQWKTLEDRITPELCSIFGVKDGGEEAVETRKLISGEVVKTLRYAKRLTDDFFNENEAVS